MGKSNLSCSEMCSTFLGSDMSEHCPVDDPCSRSQCWLSTELGRERGCKGQVDEYVSRAHSRAPRITPLRKRFGARERLM